MYWNISTFSKINIETSKNLVEIEYYYSVIAALMIRLANLDDKNEEWFITLFIFCV